MLNKIIPLMFIVCVSGCDYQWGQKHEFKWAVIEKSKIEKTILETIKKNNPYPSELLNDEETREDSRLTEQQISQLENDIREKCKAQANIKDIDTLSTPLGSHLIIDGKLMNPRVGGLNNYKVYSDCISKTKEDPLISDLKNKVKKLISLDSTRRSVKLNFDNELTKKANDLAEKTIEEYAKKNNFQLLVYKYADNIVYNSDKVMLDVTDDILDFFSRSKTNDKVSN